MSGKDNGAETRPRTLTVEETPSHNHTISDQTSGNSIKLGYYSGNTNYALSKRAADYDYDLKTNETGGGAAHNNMPPYLTVYMWKRTA